MAEEQHLQDDDEAGVGCDAPEPGRCDGAEEVAGAAVHEDGTRRCWAPRGHGGMCSAGRR